MRERRHYFYQGVCLDCNHETALADAPCPCSCCTQGNVLLELLERRAEYRRLAALRAQLPDAISRIVFDNDPANGSVGLRVAVMMGVEP